MSSHVSVFSCICICVLYHWSFICIYVCFAQTTSYEYRVDQTQCLVSCCMLSEMSPMLQGVAVIPWHLVWCTLLWSVIKPTMPVYFHIFVRIRANKYPQILIYLHIEDHIEAWANTNKRFVSQFKKCSSFCRVQTYENALIERVLKSTSSIYACFLSDWKHNRAIGPFPWFNKHIDEVSKVNYKVDL